MTTQPTPRYERYNQRYHPSFNTIYQPDTGMHKHPSYCPRSNEIIKLGGFCILLWIGNDCCTICPKIMITLQECFDQFIEYSKHTCTEHSITHYINRFKSMRRYWDSVGLLDKPVSEAFSVEHMRALWMFQIKAGLKSATLEFNLSVLKMMRSLMVNKRQIEFDEYRLVLPSQMPIKPRAADPDEPYTEEEYQLLKKNAEGNWLDIIQIGWETGLRFGDIVDLRAEEIHIDGPDKHLKITPRKTRKSGIVVQTPISDEMAARLKERMESGRLTGEACIFPEMSRKYAEHYRFDMEFKQIAKKLKINKGFHSLRRGVVTRLVMQGHDSAMIMSLTGQSPATMQKYVRIPIAAKRKMLGFSK